MPSDDLETEAQPTAPVDGDADVQSPSSGDVVETSASPTEADGPSNPLEAAARALANERGEPRKEPDPEPVAGEEEAKAEGDEPEDKAKAKKDGPDGEDDGHIPDADFKALTPAVQKRIGVLTKKFRASEAALSEKTAELTDVKTRLSDYQQRAENFDQFQGVMQRNNIDGQSLANTMEVTAAIVNGQWDEALQLLTPYWRMVNEQLGKSVASDLQEKVDSGEMTEEAALEMTRRSAEAARLRAENERYRTGQEATRRQTEHQERVEKIARAATDEAEKLRGTDPQFTLKEPHIAEAMRAHVKDFGPVSSPEAGAKLVRFYHEQVTMRLAAQSKPKTPPSPTPSGSPALSRPPANAMEAAKAALANSRMH